jgi:hypothetical protein
MSLKRIGVVMPPKNVPTLLGDVNSYYLASVIATNVNPTETANITIYVKQPGEEDEDNFVYVTHLFPLSRQNSFETIRFAMNPLDEVWVESTVDEISFMASGIPQASIAVRYTVGPTERRPTAPQPGDQFFDTNGETLNIYSGSGGWQGIIPSTGYNSVDGGNAFSVYGNIEEEV